MTTSLAPEPVTAPPHVLLAGIVGSTAYGLAHEDSDVDRIGMYAAPTQEFHGLHPPLGRNATHVTVKPDATYHEAGKFAALCLKANPTVTELLWLPGDLYETRTPLGNDLITIRRAFLSAKAVRNAYLGYATGQFRRLENRGDGTFSSDTRKRTAKHARHLWRLIHQGVALHLTGRLTIRLSPDEAATCRDFGEQVAEDPGIARALLASAEARFDQRGRLRTAPDVDAIETWLLDVRRAKYLKPDCARLGRYEPPAGAPKAVLCDIDGTLALRSDRSPYDFTRCGEDAVNEPVANALDMFRRSGMRAVLLSGRSSEHRARTEDWLKRNIIRYDELHMRPEDDYRSDAIVKAELFAAHVRDRFDVQMVLDDRDRVVRLWRDLGLACWQVAEGDF